MRPYLLARREHLNPASAFATIMLERLLDLATVLLLFAAFVLHGRPRRHLWRSRRSSRG